MPLSAEDAPPALHRWLVAGRLWGIPAHLASLDAAAVAALAVAAAAVWLLLRGTSIDDPYVTYRYARNIAGGLGFVYNPGEPILSTSSTLYALVLAITAMFNRDIPATSNLISTIALFGSGLTLYSLGRHFGERALGFLAALFFVLSPYTTGSLGLETNLYLSLILAGYLAFVCRRDNLMALCLALAVITRGDAVLPAGLIAVNYLVQRRKIPWQSLGIFLLVTVPVTIYLIVTFGSPLPTTLAAKQAQLQVGAPDYLAGLRDWATYYAGQTRLYLLVLPLVVLGVAHALARARWLLLPALWAALHVAAYASLGVASYFWYYAPVVPALALLAAAGTALLARLVTTVVSTRLSPSPAFYGALMLLAALPLLRAEAVSIQRAADSLPDPRYQIYEETGRWLRDNTPKDATVGVMEVGIIGYFAERPMVDFLGLIEPPATRALQHRDIFWSVYHYQPDFLVFTHVNPLWGYPVFEDKWFLDAYKQVKGIVNPRYWSSPVTIYRRVLPRQPELVPSPVSVDFGGKLLLTQYAIDRPVLHRGEYLVVNLGWREEQPAKRKYGVTAQLISAGGRLLEQGDVTTESEFWAGEAVDYFHFIKVPADAAPGTYQLRVAVYNPLDASERLPVLSGPSASDPDRIATLTTVQVAP